MADILDDLRRVQVVDVRRNHDGSIDEIVASGCDFHMEQMSDDGWYFGIVAKDGSLWQFWIGSKNRKSHVIVRHTETAPP